MTHTPNTLPPLPQPWDYCYEWNGPYGTRKFSVAPHNGRKPDATVQVYTADQMQAYARAALAQSAQAPAPEATLRLELEFDGEQQPIEIVAHGTDTHMRRLKARINYWLSLEKAAQAPVPAQRLTAEHVKFILEAVPDIGDAQAREWAIARAVEREALSIDAPAAPAQPAPSVVALMTPDAARKVAHDVRMTVAPSDSPSSAQYVAAGWRAAVEALAQERDDARRAARYEADLAQQALDDLRATQEAVTPLRALHARMLGVVQPALDGGAVAASMMVSADDISAVRSAVEALARGAR